MMPNCLQYPIALFGVLRAGLTVVNTNPMYTARELKHQLKSTPAPARIVVLDNFAHTVAEVVAETPVQAGHHHRARRHARLSRRADRQLRRSKYVKKMVPDFDLPGADRASTTRWRWARRHRCPTVDIGHDDIAFLQYTGGTTGVAKGAMLTHRNMVANMQQASAWIGTDA